jgi:putative addiction module component (TIGR02574 family)
MASQLPLPPPGFDDLTPDDQIEYVQSLWDRIAAKPEQVPVPEWHREVIRQRMADHEGSPAEGRPWDNVREEIRGKLKGRKSSGQ